MGLQAKLNEPGSAVRSLPPGTFTAVCHQAWLGACGNGARGQRGGRKAAARRDEVKVECVPATAKASNGCATACCFGVSWTIASWLGGGVFDE